MPEVKKNAISFKSSNGTDIVAGYYYTCPGWNRAVSCKFPTACANTSAVMTILPGIWRRKAMWFAATTNLGHGATSSGPNGTDGYFAEKDGRKFVLQDLHEMNRLAREAYRSCLLSCSDTAWAAFLRGCMPSCIRKRCMHWCSAARAGPNPLAGVGLALTEAIGR